MTFPNGRLIKTLSLILLYGGLLAVGYLSGGWLKDVLSVNNTTDASYYVRHAMWFGILLYIVLLATPFVPGIEVSLAVLAAFGKDAALLIYAASIVALTLSYLVGRLVPLRSIAFIFRYFGLSRAQHFVEQLGPLGRHDRLALLVETAPKRIVPTLIKHRYIALAVVMNLPGNAIIGGGGGIALMAGISGLFAFLPFVGVIAIAVVPIPLLTYLFAG